MAMSSPEEVDKNAAAAPADTTAVMSSPLSPSKSRPIVIVAESTEPVPKRSGPVTRAKAPSSGNMT